MDNLKDLILEDVRCFRGEQRGSLRPITLLIGENSTGKTTFLGCYGVLQQVCSWWDRDIDDRLDFNDEPFAMGSFRRIVYSTGGAFAREVGRRTRDRLLTFVRAGRAESIPADRFAADERALTARPDLRSDDAHVLALARKTGVRLLLYGRPRPDRGLQGQAVHRPAERQGLHARGERRAACGDGMRGAGALTR